MNPDDLRERGSDEKLLKEMLALWDKPAIRESMSAVVAQGVPVDSPLRGDAGNPRNFKRMSPAKLRDTIKQAKIYGRDKDPEAYDLLMDEAKDRGMIAIKATGTIEVESIDGAWTPDKTYAVGTVVKWQGLTLECQRQHVAGPNAVHPWHPWADQSPAARHSMWEVLL